jgi:Mg2+/Co2+ transporter CorB
LNGDLFTFCFPANEFFLQLVKKIRLEHLQANLVSLLMRTEKMLNKVSQFMAKILYSQIFVNILANTSG